MQREIHTPSLAWPDKTMSVIQQRQLEACEERLNALPDFGLFEGCTDANVEDLWRLSYDAQEEPHTFSLHSAKGLAKHILDRLDLEAALLTYAEYDMVQHLVVGFGRVEIKDWNEVSPAESLVRRLWCTVKREDDRDFLCMPEPVLQRVALLFQNDAHRLARDQIQRFGWCVICALNVCGMIYAEDALTCLHEQIHTMDVTGSQRLLMRMLRIAFDYTYTPSGEMVLLHPGMADPDRTMHLLRHIRVADYEIADMEDASQFLLSDAERSASEMLYGLIHENTRPEIHPGMAVEDLRLLAHQAVSFETLSEVLASRLAVRPTRDMLDALRVLQNVTPDFIFVSARTVH